jgi:acyl carrier protein
MKEQTSTGRMDQNARSAADTKPVPAKAPDSAPRTRIERLVAKCWEEELKVTGIGMEDDFFALGGDSKSALQMIYRVQEQLPPVLPLTTLFFHDPTLKGFAAQISEFFQIEDEPDGTQPDAH